MTSKLKTSKTKLEIQKDVVRKSFLVSLITFVIVLITVFFCWRYAVEGVRFRQRVKFEAFSKEMSILIVSRIRSYIEVLYGAQRFFAASKEVERDKWKAFVSPENLQERYPAIRAMRFIKRVQAEDLSNFVDQVKNDTSIYPEGFPQFQIKDLSEEGGVLNVKSEAFVVTYVEPYEGNEKMLGMDVSSDQFYWKAYEQAWVTGEPAIAKITEITSKNLAFAICFPVYQQGAPLFSVQEKKKAHIGFIDIVFRTQDFFKSIFGKNQIFNQIQYEVFDGEVKDPDSAPQKLIFQSWDPSETESYRKSFFRNYYRVMVPGSDWTLFFYASKDFAAQEVGQEIPQLVLLGGFLLGFLIWAVLYVLSTSRFQAVTLAQNITQDLRESEQKFRAITQSATDAIISIDSQGIIIFWNQGAERSFGYQENEILGKNASLLMPEKGMNPFLNAREEHLIGKTIEVHAIRKDGTEFPVEISLANWQREEKHFFTAILRDINKRKRAEKRESVEHNIVKLLAAANTLKVAASNIIESVCKQLDWAGGALWLVDDQKTAVRCFEVWFEDNDPETLRKYTDAFEKGKGMPGHVWEKNDYIWTCDVESKTNPKSTVMFPIGSAQEVVGVLEFTGNGILEPDEDLIKMFRTVSIQLYQFIQRKVAEEELVKAQSTLADREKSDMIAQLAAGVAHEVKNPLTILLQGTDYLKSNGKLKGKEDVEVVTLMVNAIDRADRIIKGLLELSRPETLNVHPEDIHMIIDTSLLLFKNQLDRRSIVVKRQFETAIPKIHIDRGKIEQVFINLFSNAIEAMGEAGELVVRTHLLPIGNDSDKSKNQKKLIVEIKDTGPGVPESLINKIFTPFVTGKRAKGGSGLGLPIVRNIMEMHKGWVQIENVKGRGAKVSLIFPI